MTGHFPVTGIEPPGFSHMWGKFAPFFQTDSHALRLTIAHEADTELETTQSPELGAFLFLRGNSKAPPLQPLLSFTACNSSSGPGLASQMQSHTFPRKRYLADHPPYTRGFPKLSHSGTENAVAHVALPGCVVPKHRQKEA
ncbi:hypothetical protein P7K49_000575 [Saguinus oedipus]|uniref:Uncharacterized protein n=1 Tax=Saguinus oedipus TaxID=9490 RepID=A0ABQ9WC18_SAGOE|nr:hypothetical protein P7K49_000575 [Saguinus oedipus]